MTSDRGDKPPSADTKPAILPDAGHLDEDAEALEDPVHCGDAKHQHDLHDRARHQND
jgi:hypothetical protein